MSIIAAKPTPIASESTGTLLIGDVRWRERVRVRGKVRALRVQPWEGGVATLECTLVDETGGLVVIFMGRRRIGGVTLGRPWRSRAWSSRTAAAWPS